MQDEGQGKSATETVEKTDQAASDDQVPTTTETELIQTPPAAVPGPEKSSNKGLWVVIAVLVVAILGVCGYGYWHKHNQPEPAVAKKVTFTKVTAPAVKAQGLVLDTRKNYGNKYANGLLPVGDGHYVTDKPKAGYIYACSPYAQNIKADTGGAQTRGPWFTNGNTQYDTSKKAHVLGSVVWQAQFTNTVSGATRTIVTNDLPSHPTGIFPIASTDPAYVYDRNPNSIKGQTLTFALSSSPTYNVTPKCMGGQVGVMLTGIALFNAFDAGGRDAGAWEVQDSCAGHPEKEGEYHYHTLSSCIKDISVHTVVGYALDGYPITGPQVSGSGDVLTTSDLDECHGITSAYFVNGKSVTGYHYVMTQDFPYSVSCFRATAIQPPGLQATPTPQ